MGQQHGIILHSTYLVVQRMPINQCKIFQKANQLNKEQIAREKKQIKRDGERGEREGEGRGGETASQGNLIVFSSLKSKCQCDAHLAANKRLPVPIRKANAQ